MDKRVIKNILIIMHYKNKSKKYFLLICVAVIAFFSFGVYFVFPDRFIQLHLSLSKILESEKVKARDNVKIERKFFGYSAGGRAIDGYEIGSGENSLLLLAAIHGNEIASSDLLNRLVMEIILKPDLVFWGKKLIIIPTVNPDGYYERRDKLNRNGVNLDLNFATSNWREYGPEGTYAGKEPFSEPESRIIKKIVEQYDPKTMISFHSYGDLVSPEAGESSVKLAKWYISKTGYRYYDAWDYPGTATKWFTETTGNPAITVEISKDSMKNWEINKKALFDLISVDSISILN